MKVFRVGPVIAVRSRLMNAVFFLRAESRDLLTTNTSSQWVNRSSHTVEGVSTLLSGPGTAIEVAQFALRSIGVSTSFSRLPAEVMPYASSSDPSRCMGAAISVGKVGCCVPTLARSRDVG